MRFVCLCCILSLVVGHLEPIKENEEDNQIIIEIISELDPFILFRNLITYMGNEYQTPAMATSLQQRLMENFNHPVIVAGADIGILHRLINYENLAIIYFKGIRDPTLRVVTRTLSRLSAMIMLFVYKPNGNLVPTSILIEAFFNWCYKKSFYNAILILKHNNEFAILTYEKKLTMQIFKFSITRFGHVAGDKYCKLGRDGQYRALIAFYPSLPDAFLYNSSKTISGNSRLGGVTGLLLIPFLDYVNVSMDIIQLSFEEYTKKIYQGCKEDRCIDVGVNLMPNVSVSPPSPLLTVTQTCLLLPYNLWTPLEAYPLSFDKNHSVMLFMTFYFFMNTVIKRLTKPHMPLGAVFYWSFRLMMGQTISSREFRQLGLSAKFIHTFTQLYIFLMLSILSSALTSALVLGLRQPQIVNAETFLASGLRIMVSPQQLESFFDYIPHSLSHRLLIVDQSVRDQHVLSLNNSFAYVTQTHKWLVLDFLQERLRQPKLRLSPQELCGVQRYMSFYVRFGLCFSRALRNFVTQSQESGLTEKWKWLGLRLANEAGILSQAPYEPLNWKPLSGTWFLNVFMIHGFGLLLGLVSMLLECLYAHFKNR